MMMLVTDQRPTGIIADHAAARGSVPLQDGGVGGNASMRHGSLGFGIGDLPSALAFGDQIPGGDILLRNIGRELLAGNRLPHAGPRLIEGAFIVTAGTLDFSHAGAGASSEQKSQGEKPHAFLRVSRVRMSGPVVGATEPDDIQGSRIVSVMALGGSGSTDFAGLTNDLPALDVGVEVGPSDIPAFLFGA